MDDPKLFSQAAELKAEMLAVIDNQFARPQDERADFVLGPLSDEHLTLVRMFIQSFQKDAS